MRDLVSAVSGSPLDLKSYDADFYREIELIDAPVYKTERIQHFVEPGHPSWEAFAAGRWDEALRLAAQPNPDLMAFLGQLQRKGSGLRRLRVVELPLTPYLQWELHHLRHRAAAGEEVRVLDATGIADWEAAHGPLPELMILGGRLLYEVCYDETGAARGARKITDSVIVSRCHAEVVALFERAEPLAAFFDRAVAPLAPPGSRQP